MLLRLLMIVSGGFEALFGLSVLLAPGLLIGALGMESSAGVADRYSVLVSHFF